MGAWGVKPFENDDAADFVAEFEQHGVVAISRALDAGCGTGGYIEAPDGSVAVAAAAIVATAGGMSGFLSESAETALRSVSSWQALTGLKAKAIKAVECIGGQNSELMELWNDAEPADAAGFKSELRRLREALR
ncbi:uncharacterized protein DUF4259 [Aminobacter aminovorans]|uniref:DUF4259 domain-containing protein n=1 Tax=Aminobacter aminovorans TaxID=83263 RepID=A0A380WTM5_AMIAI|nr:DUF4259 domain-containing protein [Aminobacter aminovorans]TCS20439.1 uncharacterized protein DUF4259 [Aminobacter aminovorans]SUU91494.1 Uncharacterised protein [Aminobacter aminovorans]